MASGSLVVVLMVLVASVHGQLYQTAPIPIPSEEPLYRFNPDSEGARVKLEAFIELICPDSLHAWPILEDVQDYYGAANLDLVFKIQTLSYHQQAWLTTNGARQVADKQPDALKNYFTLMLNNYEVLGNTATANLSEVQVSSLIGDLQENVTGINGEEFASDLGGYASVTEWKYAARRGIAGTPWFVLNGVDLAINPSIQLSLDDWRGILDPILQPMKHGREGVHPKILGPKKVALKKTKQENMVAPKPKP